MTSVPGFGFFRGGHVLGGESDACHGSVRGLDCAHVHATRKGFEVLSVLQVAYQFLLQNLGKGLRTSVRFRYLIP